MPQLERIDGISKTSLFERALIVAQVPFESEHGTWGVRMHASFIERQPSATRLRSSPKSQNSLEEAIRNVI